MLYEVITLITRNGSGTLYHNIYLIGDHALIENNEITKANTRIGIRFYGSDITIRKNFIWRNEGSAMVFWSDLADGVYSGIKIYDNVLSSGETPPEGGGIGITTHMGTFNGAEIYNNTIYVMNT